MVLLTSFAHARNSKRRLKYRLFALYAKNKTLKTLGPVHSYPSLREQAICCVHSHTDIFRFILISLIIASCVPQGRKRAPSFEQTAETGMLSKAGKDKRVVKTVLPMKAAKEEVVVEPEDETELEDDANVPLWGAIFIPLRFSECLYSDMSFICRRKD